MAEPQKKTVQFPGAPPPKEIPTVNMHPMSPLVDKVLVPAAWFVGGIVFAKLLLTKKESPTIIRGGL
jgi:hypothetical protein